MQNSSAKRNLTDRTLKSLEKQKAPKGTTYDIMDTAVPGLGVRVSETGRRTFILVARYPGSKNPTRRALGQYGALELTDARAKARKWIALIEKGTDPADEEEQQQRAEQRKRQNSFAAVADEFIKYIHRQKLRTAPVMEHNLTRTFVTAAKWGPRPITQIIGRCAASNRSGCRSRSQVSRLSRSRARSPDVQLGNRDRRVRLRGQSVRPAESQATLSANVMREIAC